MQKKYGKLFLVWLFSLAIVFGLSQCVLAQGDDASKTRKIKPSNAYLVLGREFTAGEKDLYLDLTVDEIGRELLYREQNLVIVRALITIGAVKSIDFVLKSMPLTESKPYYKLVDYFSKLQEKYGKVTTGIRAQFVERITDDQFAFEQASLRAYETVFCNEPQEQDKAKLFTFFKQGDQLTEITYTEMVQKLLLTLNIDDKRGIVFNALDSVGRADLKKDEKFINKILEQDFTCDNLLELFQSLRQ